MLAHLVGRVEDSGKNLFHPARCAAEVDYSASWMTLVVKVSTADALPGTATRLQKGTARMGSWCAIHKDPFMRLYAMYNPTLWMAECLGFLTFTFTGQPTPTDQSIS